MQVVVSLEHRFEMTPDGSVWSKTMFAHNFWQRYLAVFDHVFVMARVQNVPTPESDWKPASGEGVSFLPVPYYQGLGQYAKSFKRIHDKIRAVYRKDAAYILKVPSLVIGDYVSRMLYRKRHPYAVEVIGDPWDAFSPGVMRHPLRPFFRHWFAHKMRYTCSRAAAALYVTESALQKRYPVAKGAPSVGCSDVELPPQAIVDLPRSAPVSDRRRRLISVGSLNQLYKGPDLSIDAVAECIARGMDLELVFIGDGTYLPLLEERAKARGIADRVYFRGALAAGDAIRKELDAAVLFLMPSRAEGLPRALVEAMARALPCIGSSIGGIPELLSAEDLVAPSDASALAEKIKQVLESSPRLAEMSRRNLAKSRQYADEVLHRHRTDFYGRVFQITREAVRA